MTSSQVTMACFKFEDVEDSYDEFCLDAEDGRGAKWQLMFNASPLEERWGDAAFGDDSVKGYLSLIHLPDGMNQLVINAKVSLVVRNQSGDVLYEYNMTSDLYDSSPGSIVEFKDFAKWSALKEMLVDGALILDAIIQYQGVTDPLDNVIVPKNPFRENMLNLLDSEEDKDVFFNVEGQIIGAHKLILKANSSVLANYCENGGGASKESPIIIKDTKPHIFMHVLRFLYGGSGGNVNYVLRHGREIIDACDKYDVVALKIAAEAVLVLKRVINVDNVAEWIQYADAKTCPLLKEYALSYFALRYRDVLKTKAYKSMKQCPRLMEEVMIAALPTLDERFGKSRKKQSVNDLRKELDSLGLDLDGSKEILLSRLYD